MTPVLQPSGNARKLFEERMSKTFFQNVKVISSWPVLDKMLSRNILGYVDIALAHQLLERYPPQNEIAPAEVLAALICHMSMAAKRGHVCIKIEEKSGIMPSVQEIWVEENAQDEASLALDQKTITELLYQAARMTNHQLIHNVDELDEGISPAVPIYRENNRYYLQRYWNLESRLLMRLKHGFLCQNGAQENEGSYFVLPPALDLQKVQEQVDRLMSQGKLLPEQAQAILAASQCHLTLITGGPGTGKTYTAGRLIQTLWGAIQQEDRSRFTMALAAPTGKAAANLERSIRRAVEGLGGFPHLTAQTLHQLLKIKNSGRSKEDVMLSADLILVDESSMIDLNLMERLLSAIKPGARLILLGDRYQLPSVEAGAVFADLITVLMNGNQNTLCEVKRPQVVELKTCLRSDLKGIVDLATLIKLGKSEEACQLIEKAPEGIQMFLLDNQLSVKEQHKRFLSYVLPYFPSISFLSKDPIDLLEHFSQFKILTPTRKGIFGADTLNALILQALSNEMSRSHYTAVPIIIMQNDYRLNLFNGETGVLIKEHDKEFGIFFSRDSDKGVRHIPRLLLPRFEYAYCLSIHKSQGSEFERVALIVPDGAISFGREALYTGVTRAKKHLDIWSRPDLLHHMLAHVGARQSGLAECMLSSASTVY